MTLPFTHEQFLDVFGQYNAALWPAALLIWVATAVLGTQLARGAVPNGRALSAFLAVQWIWAGTAYHLAFFRAINPAALAFGVLFVLQGALFLWRGVIRRDLVFVVDRSVRSRVALLLVLYALLYPAMGLASGLRYPRSPTFGVPCPTTILTAGLLLLAPARAARWVAPVVLAWAFIGGSAAFLLGMTADLALVAAGVLLTVRLLRRPDRSPGHGAPAHGDR